jgi:hypothetical protein
MVSPTREPTPELLERCVVPFYLNMMRENAPTPDGLRLLPLIADVAARTTPDEVALLLAADWRPRVMGAWLAVRFRGGIVEQALLDSMRTCLGDLTAPPLAAGLSVLLGERALPALTDYLDADARQHLGGGGAVAAAIEELGGDPRHGPPSTVDRQSHQRMLLVARTLQAW